MRLLTKYPNKEAAVRAFRNVLPCPECRTVGKFRIRKNHVKCLECGKNVINKI
jgi:hypothetical protein